tara:strand:- start:679 stop:1356 length:678 start_codon:yes stop_codon:yes gene_type:complete
MPTDIAEQVSQVIIGKILLLIPIVFIIGLVRVFLSSPKVKGAIGEKVISHGILRKLDPIFYTVYDDVYLPRPDGRGTTQIDHVVVSPFGVFVIETKNMKGWIFGDEKSKQWTQTLYRKKFRFQNPLHQNQLHVNALAKSLQIPKEKLKNVVFFIGDVRLKTELPSNVLTEGLVGYIHGFQCQELNADECERIQSGLRELDRGVDRKAVQKKHVQDVQERSMAKSR